MNGLFFRRAFFREMGHALVVRRLIVLLCVACPALVSSGASAAQDAKPNFVFILADDCTYNLLGCYGGTEVKTPNIDRLASEGMRFSRAYCAIAMCAPFRTELYTGLYPMRSGACWYSVSATT